MWRWPASLLIALALVAAAPATPARSPICTRGLTTVERDPRGLLMLRRNSISASAAAALAYESRANDPIVVSAVLATADRDRGTSARYACGIRVWRRTVVVYVRRRAMLPSQSLSQGVFFVGRFRDGYHVWQVVH